MKCLEVSPPESIFLPVLISCNFLEYKLCPLPDKMHLVFLAQIPTAAPSKYLARATAPFIHLYIPHWTSPFSNGHVSPSMEKKRRNSFLSYIIDSLKLYSIIETMSPNSSNKLIGIILRLNLSIRTCTVIRVIAFIYICHFNTSWGGAMMELTIVWREAESWVTGIKNKDFGQFELFTKVSSHMLVHRHIC
jgi:hypothetical protein